MKKMRARLFPLFLFTFSVIGAARVEAMPFSPDPISFAGYLNSTRDWSDRSLRIRFENLGSCEYFYNDGNEAYACYLGYAKIKDQYSSRLCRVKVFYNWQGDRTSTFNESECRDFNAQESGGSLYRRAKEWLKRF